MKFPTGSPVCVPHLDTSIRLMDTLSANQRLEDNYVKSKPLNFPLPKDSLILCKTR